MSKQKIVVIPLGAQAEYFEHKEFNTVKELSDWIKENEDKINPAKDLKIFVGEERCLEIQKGRASNHYNVSLTGCNCGQRKQHNPREWDIKHGVIQEF
jgi:hypothetical protein